MGSPVLNFFERDLPQPQLAVIGTKAVLIGAWLGPAVEGRDDLDIIDVLREW